MSADDWTAPAIAISGIASAIGAAVAAGAAVYAAHTWRKSIKYQRIDDAIMAVLQLRSNACRVRDLMKKKAAEKDVSNAYQDAWLSCNRFEQAYVVAQNYGKSQSDWVA